MPRLPRLALFFFAFFHPLGEAGFRVDEAFSGITHVLIPAFEVRFSARKSAEHYTQEPERRSANVLRIDRVARSDVLDLFHPAVREWFAGAFDGADEAAAARLAGDRPRRVDADPRADRQRQDARRVSLVPQPPDVRAARRRASERCRVLYVSPLKALAVDVERNLRAPLAGIANVARARGTSACTCREIAIRTGDTPAHRARAVRPRSRRHPDHDAGVAVPAADVERARAARSVDTVIIDEIHALVPGKRGAHLALSLERLEALRDSRSRTAGPLQRIGLSATQRPLDEVARFLGGAGARAPTNDRPRRRAEGAPRQAATCRPSKMIEAELHEEFAATDQSAGAIRPVTIVDAAETQAARAAHRGAGRRHGPPDADAASTLPSGPACARPASRRRRSGRRSIRGCSS